MIIIVSRFITRSSVGGNPNNSETIFDSGFIAGKRPSLPESAPLQRLRAMEGGNLQRVEVVRKYKLSIDPGCQK